MFNKYLDEVVLKMCGICGPDNINTNINAKTNNNIESNQKIIKRNVCNINMNFVEKHV